MRVLLDGFEKLEAEDRFWGLRDGNMCFREVCEDFGINRNVKGIYMSIGPMGIFDRFS